ncbi:unnamed protein product [Cochlearia groenlandica]
MLEYWDTEEAASKRKKVAGTRKYDLDGKGMHKDNGGPKSFPKHEYDMLGKRQEGNLYGLGSEYREKMPMESVESSLARNIDIDERIDDLESKFKAVNDNVDYVRKEMVDLKEEFKGGVGDIKNSLNALLRHLGIPHTTTS